jgi:hypothetical protein
MQTADEANSPFSPEGHGRGYMGSGKSLSFISGVRKGHKKICVALAWHACSCVPSGSVQLLAACMYGQVRAWCSVRFYVACTLDFDACIMSVP